jgi:hypothetical protein
MAKPTSAGTRLVVVMSDGDFSVASGPFELSFDNAYGAGFAGHFSGSITGLVKVPAVLPEYLDNARAILPPSLPPHDVLIAINIHDEILMELPAIIASAGGRALIAPREDPAWTTPWLRDRVSRQCEELGLEAVFPKPFCSLTEDPAHPVVNQMMNDLKIGRPELKITVRDGVVEKIEVIRSAPCGDTYYVAKKLIGKPVDEKFEWWAAKYWGSYPCRGSMSFDPDFNDNMQHAAGHILIDEIRAALAAGEGEFRD